MSRAFARLSWRPIRFRVNTSGYHTRVYVVFNLVLFSWTLRIY